MLKQNLCISYCFGVYNEEQIIEKTITLLSKKLQEMVGYKNYEILIVENGSTDNTPKILRQLKNNHVRIITLKQKGHGTALRSAVQKAKYSHIVLTGADLPFGFSDLRQVVKEWDAYDIIFGSKMHPKSTYATSGKRKIASFIYSFLLGAFFQLQIRDVQGSLFLHKKRVLPLLRYCDSETGFFTTQLAIYAKKFGLTMKEIPVGSGKFQNHRQSKYHIVTDGVKMFSEIVREYGKVKKLAL